MNVRATAAETAGVPAQEETNERIATLVARARAAQRAFESAGQTTLDTAAAAAAWAIMEPEPR